MLDQLEANSCHKLFNDNLFASVKLSRGEENTKPKVLSLGVARSSSRGVLPSVLQIQENN